VRRRTRYALRIGLLALGAGVVAGLVHLAGPEELWGRLSALGWGVGLFLLPSGFVYLFEALGWRASFAGRPPVSFGRLFLIRTAGESLNNTLPSAYLGGEPFKALLLKRAGGDGMAALASVIVAKTALTVAQIVFVSLGVLGAVYARAGGAGEHRGAVVVATAVCLGIGTCCVYMAYQGQRRGLGAILVRVIERTGVGRGFLERRRAHLERLDAALTGFYRRSHGKFWVASGFCFLGWLAEAAEVVVFVELLDLPVSWTAAFAIAALGTIVKAAGLMIPGSLGAQEGGNMLLFAAFGLTQATGLAYSLTRRLREVLWIGLGFLLLAWLGGVPSVAPEEAAAEATEPVSG